MSNRLLLFLLTFLLVVSLSGVKVKKIHKNSFQDFQKGFFKGVSVDSNGYLLLGTKFENKKGPQEEFYFSMDRDKVGNIYIGTGHQARVYRINIKGVIKEIFRSDQLDVYGLLASNSGDIFVGTSPNGKIYKISRNKKTSVFFDPEEKFIWDLKEDNNGNIICAVGNSGGIFQINKTGESKKILTPEVSHVMTLYVTRDNAILAGSGDQGILYKIKNQKVKVLYDSDLEEIQGITEDKEGNIYFAAVKGKQAVSKPREFRIGSIFEKERRKDEPKIKEKSILYCLHRDGIVEQVWTSNDEYIYDIYYEPNSHSIIAGTGDFGRVYQIKPDGSYSLMFELASAQVFKLVGNKKGFFLISNNTALLTEVDGSLNRSGTYFSDIFDAKIKAKLGRITWMSESQKPGGISFFVRMGNSNIPDSTWTAWSPPYTDPENSNINISGYRYFQVKVGFIASSPDENPVLKGYQIYYLQANLKPKVSQIKINKPKATNKSRKTADRQERKHLVVSWKADDPNNDRLNFNIYVKKINAKKWLLIQKNFEKKTFKLFSELYDDGKYVLRIVVDDSKDNAPSLSKSGTHVSFPFTIDSTAPMVSDFKVDESQLRFSVIDVTSPVSEVYYSFDGNDWYPLFPEDLINDSKAENFRFKLRDLKQHQVLFIKVVDEFGNFKVFQKEI